jgi:uncharacterized tellurite resistance protein B-like protein
MPRNYPRNSAEAASRVVAMTMITDANLDDGEIAAVDELRLYELLGLTRGRFLDVVRDYCEDLVAEVTPGGRVRLLDPKRIDFIADHVDDRRLRVAVCAMMLNIIAADGALREAELAVVSRVLARWGLTLEDLSRELAVH